MDGTVSFEAFCKCLRMRSDSSFTRHLFRYLDQNEDGNLGFFEFIGGLDGFVNMDFKQKLKSYFELFCDENRFIKRSKTIKITKDVLGSF